MMKFLNPPVRAWSDKAFYRQTLVGIRKVFITNYTQLFWECMPVKTTLNFSGRKNSDFPFFPILSTYTSKVRKNNGLLSVVHMGKRRLRPCCCTLLMHLV